MKTQVKLRLQLKQFLANEPLDTITVKRLASSCGINRQTFYYHYRDIYELLADVYINEKIPNLDKVITWEKALDQIFNYIINNRQFINNTAQSAGHDLLDAFFNNVFYNVLLNEINIIDSPKKLTEQEVRFLSSFYSAGFANIVMQWIDGPQEEAPLSVIDRLINFFEGSIERVIQRYCRKQNE